MTSLETSEKVSGKQGRPLLEIEGLDVFYGSAHALQGVSLSLSKGVLGIVGRNGMGKTTLCNAITGLIPASGSIRFAGEEILGLSPNKITQRGIAYVPQGRRVWPSLTVDETLKLVARKKQDVERVYAMFPRLAERKSNGGTQLSGGEQQMLAIGRALLLEPRLLVMDEPTEGLAPVIVEHVVNSMRALVAEQGITILLIEQNLGVALDVANDVGVMVNGRIAHQMAASTLSADRELQEQLLGVRSGGHGEADSTLADAAAAVSPAGAAAALASYVVGTFDTKARELSFLRECIEKTGSRVVTVDLATSGGASTADVHPREVAGHHPGGEAAVFTGDRGSAVAGMALAFEHFIKSRRDIGGIISAGGSGGTSLATAGMRMLPIGVPKVMVSTMASGDTRPYVGPCDICMMYSVTDVQGINRISEKVLANAANALAGMVANPAAESPVTKPAIGLSMFGVTTPCVQAVTKRLQSDYDCLVFHATGVGGQSMEKLADSGLLSGVIDVSTTEVADEVGGGVLSSGPTRMDVFARHAIPYVGSCGALDMVNFGTFDSVPESYKNRKLYRHNPTVTLMRTTVEENRTIGLFIAAKLNAMIGSVRFLIPEGGVSAIDKPGQPFHDPEADQVLFETIEQNFKASPQRKLLRLPLHINDEAFADALVAAWQEINPQAS